jgi:hypothetical protein
MVEIDNAAFLRELDIWAGRYPGIRLEKRHYEGYWIALHAFPLRTVSVALHRAADASPRYIPSASAVREHCLQIEREERNAQADELRHRATELDGEPPNPAPSDPAMQQRYIEAATTPCERLARALECEITHHDHVRPQAEPWEIGAQRIAEILRAYNSQHGET